MTDDKEISIIKKPFVFISKWRSLPVYELISYFFMFASVPMLAYGLKTYDFEIIRIIILTVLTMYSSFFAALIWNDITDADIDAMAHPDRPIPSGRINKKNFFIVALIFSALTFIFAFLISIWCLFVVGMTALFVAFHNKYLKRIVKIPAYSEIFGPFQWTVVVIFGFVAVWSSVPVSSEISIDLPILGSILTSNNAIVQMILLVIFKYFADTSHDIAEGIHDADADLEHGVKTYATTFGKYNASKISIIMFIISGIFGCFIFLQFDLSLIFLLIFLLIFIYSLIYPLKLLKTNKQELEKQGSIVGRKLYDYLLFFYDIIFIGLLIQIYIF